MSENKRNIILVGCVAVLVMLCCFSIGTPIHFDNEQQQREREVKQRLLTIRQAEERYCAKHGTYTGDFDELKRKGLLADSLRYIPYSNHKTFVLRASATMGKSGRQIPLMECSAKYSDYLEGLDKTSVDNLTDEAIAQGRFPGLKIGDLEEPNNNAGNWE